MGIPESQLQAWSNQGAVVTAQLTHNSIRTALEAYKKWPDGVTYDPYLQGSYRNFTNIYGNSDVDLVVELTSVFYSNLTAEEKLQIGITPGYYSWGQFRQDVISALVNYYGSSLVDTTGSKSIKVLPGSGRLKADVVVCCTYRHYEDQRIRAEGITFWTQPHNQQIFNYPKIHFGNGAEKNSEQRTRSRYRPSTRMFKNARERIVSNHPNLRGIFPSYYIECLLYNVPDRCYEYSFQNTYTEVVNWLNTKFDDDDVGGFICQNGMYYLFGPSSVQWNKNDARNLVTELISLWNNW